MVHINNRSKNKAGNNNGKINGFKNLVMPIICEKTLNVIKGKNDELQGLQETKNMLCKLENNPFNMVLIKNYANAKVRHWLISMVHNDMEIKLPSGNVDKSHIDALDIDGNVVFVNYKYVIDYIGTVKDTKVKAKSNERLKALMQIPKRESYY